MVKHSEFGTLTLQRSSSDLSCSQSIIYEISFSVEKDLKLVKDVEERFKKRDFLFTPRNIFFFILVSNSKDKIKQRVHACIVRFPSSYLSVIENQRFSHFQYIFTCYNKLTVSIIITL
jgi:hypothetical protein